MAATTAMYPSSVPFHHPGMTETSYQSAAPASSTMVSTVAPTPAVQPATTYTQYPTGSTPTQPTPTFQSSANNQPHSTAQSTIHAPYSTTQSTLHHPYTVTPSIIYPTFSAGPSTTIHQQPYSIDPSAVPQTYPPVTYPRPVYPQQTAVQEIPVTASAYSRGRLGQLSPLPRKRKFLIKKHTSGLCGDLNPNGMFDRGSGACRVINCNGCCDRERITYKRRNGSDDSIEAARKINKNCC